jgi:hypothetical protein
MNDVIVTGKTVNNGLTEYEKIDYVIEQFENRFDTDPDFRNKVYKHIGVTEGIKKQTRNWKKSKINFEELIDNFLNTFDSIKTRKNYYRSIRLFLSWLQIENIEPLEVTPVDMDRYLLFLKDSGRNYSSNTIRLYTMGIVSLYNYVMRLHNDLFITNPVHGVKLPKLDLKKERDTPTVEDIKTVRDYCESINRDDFVLLMDILPKYGYRIGIFKGMKFTGKNGNFKSISKGKIVSGKFTVKEMNGILKLELTGKDTESLSAIFCKFTKKLFERGKVSCSFSLHDIRRFTITNRLNSCNGNVQEMKRVSEEIGHSSLNTTLGYVS